MLSSREVEGALCLVPGGGDALDPLPAQTAFPSWVTALKSSFCGSRDGGWGLCEGEADRTEH